MPSNNEPRVTGLIEQGLRLLATRSPSPEGIIAPDGVASGPFYAWQASCNAFFQSAAGIGRPYGESFRENVNYPYACETEVGIELLREVHQEIKNGRAAESVAASPHYSRRVFVVHGHRDDFREKTARLLESLDLEPIILHEQPNEGRTVIEKFSDYSDVGFAVVLLTGDDVGGKKGPNEQSRPRARQNVVFELGFFIGRLGRGRVAAYYEAGVELPSDYSGVLYTQLDAGDAWRFALAKELRAAGLDVDLNKLV